MSVSLRGLSAIQQDEILNRLGDPGWELVAVTPVIAYLKWKKQ